MPNPVSVMLQREVFSLRMENQRLRKRNKELKQQVVFYQIRYFHIRRIMRDHFDYIVKWAGWSELDEQKKGT